MCAFVLVWMCRLTCLILLMDYGASKAVAKPNIILLFADGVSYLYKFSGFIPENESHVVQHYFNLYKYLANNFLAQWFVPHCSSYPVNGSVL